MQPCWISKRGSKQKNGNYKHTRKSSVHGKGDHPVKRPIRTQDLFHLATRGARYDDHYHYLQEGIIEPGWEASLAILYSHPLKCHLTDRRSLRKVNISLRNLLT